jgi:hypothetical protein
VDLTAAQWSSTVCVLHKAEIKFYQFCQHNTILKPGFPHKTEPSLMLTSCTETFFSLSLSLRQILNEIKEKKSWFYAMWLTLWRSNWQSSEQGIQYHK